MTDHDGLDLLPLHRDAALLDALASRSLSAAVAADPVIALLAAFAEQVDDGLDQLAPLGTAGPIVVPQPDGPLGEVLLLPRVAQSAPASRRTARAALAMAVAVAALSVSGAAAAMTGDPLAPYKRVVDVVSGHPRTTSPAAGEAGRHPGGGRVTARPEQTQPVTSHRPETDPRDGSATGADPQTRGKGSGRGRTAAPGQQRRPAAQPGAGTARATSAPTATRRGNANGTSKSTTKGTTKRTAKGASKGTKSKTHRRPASVPRPASTQQGNGSRSGTGSGDGSGDKATASGTAARQ
ncbi:MAG: hypothetical protein ACXV3C_01560 [Actinomycetes bacterium]